MPRLPIVGIIPIFWGLGANFDVDQHLRLPFIGAIWRQATQLQLGLFPDSAALIPEYIGWTHSEMQSVQRLFEVAGNKSADQVGILFTSRTHPELAPAKKLWKDAWKKIWKRLDGYNLIVQLLHRNACHPHQIMTREGQVKFPSKPVSLGNLHQDIANEVFGPEISTIDRNDGEMMISMDVMDVIDKMVSIVWHNLQVQTSRTQKEAGELHVEILRKYDEIRACLDGNTPDKLNMPKIRSFIRSYLTWREKARLFIDKHRRKEITEMETYMEWLLHHMHVEGAENKLVGNKMVVAVTATTLYVLQNLANDEQRMDLERYLVELWDQDVYSLGPEDLREVQLTNCLPSGGQQSWGIEDLGIEAARGFSLEQLKEKLGLNLGHIQSQQLGFLNTEYDVSQIYSPWDRETWKDYRQSGNIQPLHLQEQQLDGLHSIYSMLFRPRPSPKTGILIADTMGIGKTA
ncbi:uncharacterized protein EI90DRAFT_3159013 [Cantharellus anzutake]|uniref:uncharacterized protein n=1 Tax=Cantharellus anzutake TaxID=1750568 RepID=UPI001903D71E|nr:uncharacterized protein EI90DRAFT_3159013 [Cantharellus anzutake]KAF8316001.1 hypothetical protein EI90DRAFT_3159013 [Cantharellus anzutake]